MMPETNTANIAGQYLVLRCLKSFMILASKQRMIAGRTLLPAIDKRKEMPQLVGFMSVDPIPPERVAVTSTSPELMKYGWIIP